MCHCNVTVKILNDITTWLHVTVHPLHHICDATVHFLYAVLSFLHLNSLCVLIFRFWHIMLIALLTSNNTYNAHNKFTVHWNNNNIIMLRLYFSRLCLTYSNPLKSGSDMSVSHEFRGQKRLFSDCAPGRVYDRPVRWPPDLGWLTGWTEFCVGNLLCPPRWTDSLQSYPNHHFLRETWPAGGWRTSHSDISAERKKKRLKWL